jgi:hypothetical protein
VNALGKLGEDLTPVAYIGFADFSRAIFTGTADQMD